MLGIIGYCMSSFSLRWVLKLFARGSKIKAQSRSRRRSVWSRRVSTSVSASTLARDESSNARAPTEWELVLDALERNDASGTTVLVHYFDHGQSMGINLKLRSTAAYLFLEVPRRYLEGTPMTANDCALLLHYVATSTALRTVWLEPFDAFEPLDSFIGFGVTRYSIFAEQIMRAARRNNNIRALTLSTDVSFDPSQMVEFLDQTTSLKELHLDVSRCVLSDEKRLIVLGALARNTHITDLTLEFQDGDAEMLALTVTLQTLHENTTLQKLCLFSSKYPLFVPGHAWSLLLGSGIPLHCLSLSNVSFDHAAMKGLLKGLIGRDTTIDLKLNACTFSNGAIDELMCSVPTMRKHLVSTLTISWHQFDRSDTRLKDLMTKIYPLSPFQHLAINLEGNFTRALLGQLTIKSPPHMESLTLRGFNVVQTETEALAAFVKSAIHLKKLSVDSSLLDRNERAMLKVALRENGSLAKVHGGLPRTYCRRNRALHLLLKQHPIPLAKLSLVPSFCHAAKAAKKMGATLIFAGLLGCDHRY
jgi:hypothetical protein